MFSHATEFESPAGTGQNVSWGRKGFEVSSCIIDSLISPSKRPQGQSTARHRNPGPGPSFLLVSYSARVPRGTCHRWPPGLRLHSYPLRMMGKSATRPPPPPAPKQPKAKGKRHTGHLPGKGGSKVLRSLIAAPSGSLSPCPQQSQGAKSSGSGRRKCRSAPARLVRRQAPRPGPWRPAPQPRSQPCSARASRLLRARGPG